MTFRFTNVNAEAEQSAIEHGTYEHGIVEQTERTDNQFIGIINQAQDGKESYDYNKF